MVKDGVDNLIWHPCVPYTRKRLVLPSETQPKGSTYIHCLPDELLAEILYRQRCNKSVMRCKCVCKGWCALISRPDFIHELNKRNIRPSHHFIYRIMPNMLAVREAPLYKSDFLYSLEKNSLSFVADDCNGKLGKMVGTCHDLVLYCRDNDEGNCYDLHIRNIQNQQRIQLPSSSFYYKNEFVMFGFICDPPGNGDGKAWKYSVVAICMPYHLGTEFRAHFLLSTNGNKWCEKNFSLPIVCRLEPIIQGQIFQGKHLFTSRSAPFLIDPYPEETNKVIKCPLISWPPKAKVHAPRMGMCNGDLLFSYISYKESRIWVWLLDELTSKWCLLHSVAKQDLVQIDHYLKDRPFDKPWSIGWVLGFDPINSDVVYTRSARDFQSWDLRKKTLKVLYIFDIRRPDYEFAGFSSFSMSLPSVPTPLLTLLWSGAASALASSTIDHSRIAVLLNL